MQNNKLNNGYPVFLWQNTITEYDVQITVDGQILNSNKSSINSGEHRIDIDCSKTSPQTEDALLALAIYNSNGTLKNIWLSDKTCKLSVECSVAKKRSHKSIFLEMQLYAYNHSC